MRQSAAFALCEAEADRVRQARANYYNATRAFLRFLKSTSAKIPRENVFDWIIANDWTSLLPPSTIYDLTYQQRQRLRKR